jgi:hypothetical protein
MQAGPFIVFDPVGFAIFAILERPMRVPLRFGGQEVQGAECTVGQACTSAGGVTPSAGEKFALPEVTLTRSSYQMRQSS